MYSSSHIMFAKMIRNVEAIRAKLSVEIRSYSVTRGEGWETVMWDIKIIRSPQSVLDSTVDYNVPLLQILLSPILFYPVHSLK